MGKAVGQQASRPVVTGHPHTNHWDLHIADGIAGGKNLCFPCNLDYAFSYAPNMCIPLLWLQ